MRMGNGRNGVLGSHGVLRGSPRPRGWTWCRRAEATCRGRTPSAHSTPSGTTGRSPSNGRMPAWTAWKSARRTRLRSVAAVVGADRIVRRRLRRQGLTPGPGVAPAGIHSVDARGGPGAQSPAAADSISMIRQRVADVFLDRRLDPRRSASGIAFARTRCSLEQASSRDCRDVARIQNRCTRRRVSLTVSATSWLPARRWKARSAADQHPVILGRRPCIWATAA